MAKFLAREIEVYVGSTDGTGGTKITSLTSVGLSSSKNDADTTDFASEGQMSHIAASRSREVSLEGMWDPDDLGLAALIGLADDVGADGIDEFRFDFGTDNWYFDGSVVLEGPTGGNDDPATWSATITVTGEIER